MPRINYFFGITVWMYHMDHNPPHFHVRYQGQHAAISIDDIRVLYGRLSARALGLVVEAALHQDKLRENWRRAVQHERLLPIEPVE